jgi:3-hydroxy-3-methylglutaryl CoA synthase
MVSVAACGVYVPLYRIERASIAEQYDDSAGDGELAVPAHDENVLTMGLEAAKNALGDSEGQREDLDAVFTASVSDPFAERGLASHIAHAVSAGEHVMVGDFQSSARSATNALFASVDAIRAGSADTVLVVATDILAGDSGPKAELTAGAGAAALVLDDGSELAMVNARESYTSGFIGRFVHREQGTRSGDRRFERRHGYLESVKGAVEAIGDAVDTLEPDRTVLPSHGNWGSRAADALDLDGDLVGTYDEVGNAGAASVLIDAVRALETSDPGDQILLVSYGPGGSDAVLMTSGAQVPDDQKQSLQKYLDSKDYLPYGKLREYRARARGGES